jgi:hypothetical protein
MTSKPQLRSSFLVVIVLAAGACNAPAGPTILDDNGDQDAGLPSDDNTLDQSRKHPADARTPPPPPVDGRSTDAQPTPDAGGGGGSPGVPGVVSCYLEGYPSTTCSAPTHCCFSNYSAQHDGECSTSSCAFGTIDCDGPEDCASGQHCCSHAIIDPDYGLTGYKLACQAAACGAAPIDQELCHPTSSTSGTCPSGKTCVTALGNDNDLPRTLFICK